MHSFCKWGNWEIEKIICASLHINRTDTEPIFQSRHSGYFPGNHSASCPLITAVGRALLTFTVFMETTEALSPEWQLEEWCNCHQVYRFLPLQTIIRYTADKGLRACLPQKKKKKKLSSYAAEIAQEIMPRKIFFPSFINISSFMLSGIWSLWYLRDISSLFCVIDQRHKLKIFMNWWELYVSINIVKSKFWHEWIIIMDRLYTVTKAFLRVKMR